MENSCSRDALAWHVVVIEKRTTTDDERLLCYT